MLQRLKIYGPSWRELTRWNLLILIQVDLRFVHGGMRKCPGMMHTSTVILFNQPVNKVKTCPGPAPFQPLLRGPVMRGGGSSSVITPAGHQRSAELKEPWMDASSGALTGDPRFKLHAARGDPCPGPLHPCKPLLIEVQPPVGASQRDPGKGSVQNNYYVTLVSFTTQHRGGVKYSTDVWKGFLKPVHRVQIKRFHTDGFVFSFSH